MAAGTRWRGWQNEVLECIHAFARETGRSEVSVDEILDRYGKELRERGPSRDHLVQTNIRGSIGNACRALSQKGHILKVGDRGSLYKLPKPPTPERFDLPEVGTQVAAKIAELEKARDAIKALPEGADKDRRKARLAEGILTFTTIQAVLSLQRRTTLLEEAATPLPPAAEESEVNQAGAARSEAAAKTVGALIRGFFLME